MEKLNQYFASTNSSIKLRNIEKNCYIVVVKYYKCYFK